MGAAASFAVAGKILYAPCQLAFCGFSFASCCCTGSMGADGVKPYQAKIYYVFFLALGTLIGFLFGKIGEDRADSDGGFIEDLLCQAGGDGANVCDGQPAILRASLASVVFFSLMLLGTMPVPTFQGDDSWRPLLGEGFHRGYWGIKIFVYFGLIIGFFFITIDENAYINVARVVGGLFLVAQVLVLVDFAYIWDETWVERSDVENDFADGSKCWLISLIAISVLLYLAAFGGFIGMLVLYSGCTKTIGFTAYNLTISIVFVGLTLLKGYFIEDEVAGSIAPPAVVAAYVAFLSFSASQSNPDILFDDNCDPFGNALGENGLEIFLSIVISTASLVWTALTVSGNAGSLLTGGGGEREVADIGGAYEIEEADGTTKYAADGGDGDGDEEAFSDDKLWYFHAIMVTASFYLAMVLTNWGVSEADVLDQGAQIGDISMFAKASASWLAGLMFIWTIVAPAIFPDRDW